MLVMIIRMVFLLGVLLMNSMLLSGNEPLQHIRRGNAHYRDGNFMEAEQAYRQALEHDSQDSRALFNLANALYRQERFEEAADLFEATAHMSPDDLEKSSAFHNLGNALMGSQQYKESVDAFKNALRLNPDDEDSRYNLAYAMQFLEDPPPQDQDQQGDDQNEDNDQEDQDQQNDQNQQDDDGQQQEQDQQQEQNDQQQERPEQLSKQDAERILDALNQQEQTVQESIQREEVQKQPGRVEREW